MNKVYFAIALHFHQPIGNFDHVIERAYQYCYSPFLELLSDYPDIKMNFHISGCLLDYLEEKHPETIELINGMVSRRQIEIMGGGYYEPMLPAIPERDVIGQICMMSEHLEKRFNFRPKGMWIPERVWENRIAELIYDAGIYYSVLDDTHFLRSGVKEEDMHGCFLTGEGAKKIAIFPSDKKLRYSIPFELPDKTIDYFKEASHGKENLLFTYGDDGEKFGEWPGTHKWVFEDGWLRKFFDVLVQNKEWLELVKLHDYFENNKSIDAINIKDGSYEEMMEWSDGSWMNFLKKYPETNQMHKKMVYVSEKIDELQAAGNRLQVEEAQRELYKGQCNCGWWHGVFGGLYLYHLRRAIYNHLINADKIADTILHKGKKGWFEVRKIDFDKDGKDEVILENNIFSIYIDPEEGGILKELDYRPISVNLINTLSRKRESYHQKILEGIVKDDGKVKTIHDDIKSPTPGLSEKLTYDKFPRYCLRDHFLRPEINIEDFLNSRYEEKGDFAAAPYTLKDRNKSVILERESKAMGIELKLTKQVQIKSDKEIEFSYIIEKKNTSDIKAIFGIEFNLTMPDLNSDRYTYFYNGRNMAGLGTRGSAQDIDFFSICDYNKECSVGLNFSETPIDVWYFPVDTVSQSERSYELHYQCSCVFPRWRPNFYKNNTWHLRIIWSII